MKSIPAIRVTSPKVVNPPRVNKLPKDVFESLFPAAVIREWYHKMEERDRALFRSSCPESNGEEKVMSS
jgi:hypothetical protein